MMPPPEFAPTVNVWPVVTNNIPFPIDGPPIPIGVPMLNSQSFSPVPLSSTKIIPDGINGVLAGELGPPNWLVAYGFPVAVICPENTTPFVTNGYTQVGYSVGYIQFIFPVSISIAVIVPLPMPLSIASNAGYTLALLT
jgi:hypothetical protein